MIANSKFTEALFTLMIGVIIGLPVAYSQEDRESKSDDGIRVVIQLNEQSLATLKNIGYVKAGIPAPQKNKVIAVKLAAANAFLDELLMVELESSTKRGVLTIQITDDILHQLAFQPVEIKVSDSRFSSVLLDHKSAKSSSKTTDEPKTDFNENVRFFVRKTEYKGIYAELGDADGLRIATDYCTFNVGWEHIEAVHFGNNALVSVILRNGDKISGKLKQDSLKLTTEWGQHAVNAASLFSLTRTEKQRYLANKLNNGNVKYMLYNLTENRSQSVGY